MNAAQWVAAFGAEIGQEAPDPAKIDEILKLAGIAAHASERIAAPIACYMAGVTGRPIGELIAAADQI